jgi:hypothetical protein
MGVGRRTQNESADPNQSQDSDDGSGDPPCGGGLDCVPVQDIDSVVKGRRFALACTRYHHQLYAGSTGWRFTLV